MADYHFVPHLPDLIQPEDYPGDPMGRRLRFRIRATAEGVELLGDAMHPETLMSGTSCARPTGCLNWRTRVGLANDVGHVLCPTYGLAVLLNAIDPVIRQVVGGSKGAPTRN